MRSQWGLRSRAAGVARTHASEWGAVLTIALLAACGDESVVDPPAAPVSASESSALLSATAASDRDILIALYQATDGPNWVNSENWLTDAPLGDWYGVDTDGSGRVVRLDLAENELTGSIPPELGRPFRSGTPESLVERTVGPHPGGIGRPDQTQNPLALE